MNSFTFTCSAPDDWSNWHFLIKTFGPALIAGCIALLAYRVARTQKTIATNKYHLDMFDKRFEVFSEYHDFREKILSYDKREYKRGVDDYKIILCIKELEKIMLKAYLLYDNLTVHIIKRHYFYKDRIEKINEEIAEVYNGFDILIGGTEKKISLGEEKDLSEDDLHKKLEKLVLEKEQAYVKFKNYLDALYTQMNSELKVPKKPTEN
ncbi:hypothetical protein [Acetobacter tropicalis]|nr:hypothetical protein [Acetobacter tropicalis]